MRYLTCFLAACVMSLAHVSAESSKATVLLVTSSELKYAWKPFANWKAKLGKPVKVVTVAEIGKKYRGVDIQEKIRQCVRMHIDRQGTRWVILGGDSLPGGKGHVPDRDTRHFSIFGREDDIPTDIYYLSPTSWDADGDGIYGEFVDDRKAITYPDGKVGLGRIPVRTGADVRAYTNKVISYESRYPKGQFGKNFIYTCEVKTAYAKVQRSWDSYVSKVLKGGRVYHYFADKTPWDKERPGDFQLSPDNLVRVINSKQVGKYHVHGHGLVNCWILERGRKFTKTHVARLTNKDAYPVITTVSCFTGQFDSATDPCISESMLRKSNAGAIAIVAPCREGKSQFLNPRKDYSSMVRWGKMDGTMTMMTYFWKLGIGKKLTMGEALMRAKDDLERSARKSANFHMCLCELNLLGDPTLLVHPVR